MNPTSSTRITTRSDTSQHTKVMGLSQSAFMLHGEQSSINHHQQYAPKEGGGCGTVMNDMRIRYLTPRECLRLMGFDDPSIDTLINAVPSKTNQYKLAGNSIVVDCLEAIFRAIYIDKTFRRPRPKQVSLFDIPQRPINPILMRSAEDIEREVTELEGIQ